MDSYKLTTDTVAAQIDSATGEQLAATKVIGAGTVVQTSMDASEVLSAMGRSGDFVSVHAPDGNLYAVPASNLAPVDAAAANPSATSLYVIVGVAVALVAFMYWNANRK